MFKISNKIQTIFVRSFIVCHFFFFYVNCSSTTAQFWVWPLPTKTQLIGLPAQLSPFIGRTRELAEVKRRLAAGEPFAAVSTALDEGPYGKSGGQMGTFKQGELVGDLDTQAFGLPIGGTSEPLRTPQGWFFVHVFSRKATDARPFEEVREQLRFEVMNKRLEQEPERWCEAARRQAAVTVLLEPPPKK